MLRVLVWLVLFAAATVRAEIADPPVSVAQLDSAVEWVSADLPQEDPHRETLLNLYGEAKAALLRFEQHREAFDTFSQARANAQAEAQSLQEALTGSLQSPQQAELLDSVSLAESEQMIQADRSQLTALKSRLADMRAAIDGTPGRTGQIRERLTELVGILAELDAQLALTEKTADAGGEAEARLWLAQAQRAAAQAEKTALDEELLSQPVRQALLKAQLDTTSHDIAVAEKRLAALEQRTGELREGMAAEARAEAELVRAGTEGKHQLVQKLADDNAALTASFGERGAAIEAVREREAAVRGRAEQLENDLESIQRRLEILGMTTAIGEILREQAVQLPSERESAKEIAAIALSVRESSMQQIELEDERRQLRRAEKFVQRLTEGQDEQTIALVHDDLVELVRNRRELVRKAVDLENTYSSTLGELEFSLRRDAEAVQQYGDFISERLLWIPTRETLSLFRGDGLPTQLAEVFAPDPWMAIVRSVPAALQQHRYAALAMIGLLLLVYFSPRLVGRLEATGKHVGYIRTDFFTNTLYALCLTVLLSLRWPLLVVTLAWLFELEAADSELASALFHALGRAAFYVWGLEFQRILLLPRGLAAAHFRWPAQRTEVLSRRIVRLEQTFLPAAFLVSFSMQLYPREVGGQLGALAIVAVLLSMAHFFRRLPRFVQGKMELLFFADASSGISIWSNVLRQFLAWLPVVGIIAVLLGYSYTAIEFALLLVRTVVLYAAMMLLHELGMRWLRLARVRMLIRVREERAQSAGEEAETSPEEELLENDPALLSDEGTKLLNALVIVFGLVGIALVWAGVIPALGILDRVELWHQTGIVDGREATIPVTLASLFSALLILVLGWVAVRRIPSLLEILLRQRMRVSAGSAYAATRIFQYTLVTVLVVSVMGVLGGSWSQIQWAVAALSVGIGFGLQEIVANFISGLIILFEQPIRVGDAVTVGNVSGTVTRIRMRATTIRDWERRELLVPNKEFVTSQLLNWSLSDPVTRWSLQVGVAYGTDMAAALGVVRQVALEHPLVLSSPEPIITFDEFGDNSLLITLRFFMDELDKRLIAASELRLAINERFNELGIVVAFPQRDVHFDTSGPLEIRMVEQGA